MKLIDGKAISAAVKERAAAEVSELKEQGIEVCLAVILVGDDPASQVYVGNKKKACEACGMRSLEYRLPADIHLRCGVVTDQNNRKADFNSLFF